MKTSFTEVFEPSRLALSNSGFTTAGVNLDVIVRPNNARGVLGILGCHRPNFCVADAKVTVPSFLPSAIHHSSPEEKGHASELIQNSLPHDKYIQKSIMGSPCVIFCNVLESQIKNLGEAIIKGLVQKLIISVPKSVIEDTESMFEKLSDTLLVDGGENKNSNEINSNGMSTTSDDFETTTATAASKH